MGIKKLSKQKYIANVKDKLQAMREMSKQDRFYNLTVEAIRYYESTIKADKILTTEEFLDLCKEVGKKYVNRN